MLSTITQILNKFIGWLPSLIFYFKGRRDAEGKYIYDTAENKIRAMERLQKRRNRMSSSDYDELRKLRKKRKQ